jgi:hypothetical protein
MKNKIIIIIVICQIHYELNSNKKPYTKKNSDFIPLLERLPKKKKKFLKKRMAEIRNNFQKKLNSKEL